MKKPALHFNPFVGVLTIGLLACLPCRSFAQPSSAPPKPYAAAVEALERFIAHEVVDKDLPALSIALVDNQTIIWAKGFGFANPTDKVPATANTVLPRRLRFQAVHRHRHHAARRAGHSRPRRTREPISAGLQAGKPLRQSDHAAATHGPPLRVGSRTAHWPLF